MAQRQDLQDKLVELLGTDHVYFQPPPSVKMVYPCIRYERDFILKRHADGIPYKKDNRYLVTAIDGDPDSVLPDLLADFPKCTFDRFYAADNLNHFVFKLFF